LSGVTEGRGATPFVAAAAASIVPRRAFAQGTTITFIGSATDFEDGILAGSSLVWSSGASQS